MMQLSARLWMIGMVAVSVSSAVLTTHAADAPPSPKPAKTIAPADANDISAPARRGTAKGAKDSKDAKLLWDYWYTVTSNKTHYEIYNDRVEIRDGKVVYQNRAWKHEEGYINEEQLGVFAQNDPELTPLFFNFHRTYRATERTIDGNISGDPQRQLTVRVREGSKELPLIKKTIPRKAFFSIHFPLWLGHHLPTFKTGSPYSFQTVLEDNLEANYMTVDGMIRPAKPDEFALKTHTTRLDIDYANVKSIWWVDPNGAPVRIEFPGQQQLVERVSSKAEAEKFFKAEPSKTSNKTPEDHVAD